MHFYNLYIIILLSYLAGSFPSSLILSKILKKEDIRKSGSQNIGATNAVRVHGKSFGISVLFLDVTKSIIVLIILKINLFENILGEDNDIIKAPHFLYIIAFSAILGHVFPIWLKFKGGKAVASSIAILCVLQPYLGLFIIVTWLLIFLLFKISAAAALLSFFLSFIVSLFLYNNIFIIFIIAINIIIFFRHKSNIKEIFALLNKKSN